MGAASSPRSLLRGDGPAYCTRPCWIGTRWLPRRLQGWRNLGLSAGIAQM